MSRFLAILGPQTIQCTLRFDDEVTSFIFRTTNTTVESIKIINGREAGATIDFNIDLKELVTNDHASSTSAIRTLWNAYADRGHLRGQWKLFKLLVAIGVETVAWKLTHSE
jgi:hypothetical protein